MTRAMMVAALTAVVTACAVGPARPDNAGVGSGQQQTAVKKRFTAAILKPDLASLRTSVESGSNRLVELIHAGFARTDPKGELLPQLAEQVPSTDNGGWLVAADGTMTTTWRIRADARWHDGTPVTAGDFTFGALVEQDKDLDIDAIETRDAATVVIRWKKPYIFADSMSSNAERLVPRHLLEQAYTENRAGFLENPYWTTAFVGAGPYRVQQFVNGSHVLLAAFDDYLLGRPKVDEIEVKLVPDSTTLAANILAGAVDLTLGLSLAPDEAVNLRDQWRDGSIYVSPYYSSTVGIAAQFIDPNPAVVRNLQFRRAMAHAADRQALVDSVMAGLSQVAHPFIAVPMEGIEDRVVKYDFDPRQAAQLVEGLGYRKGSSGSYEDLAGQRLSFPFWAIQEEQERAKAMLSIAEDWKRLGIDAQPYLVPAQQNDPEFLATYPAFFVRGIGGGETAVENWLHGSAAARPENRFRGNNRSRYINAEFDGLIDRYYATIPKDQRRQALGDVLHHLTDQVVGIGIFYNVDISMLNNRLVNVSGSTHFARGWDAHLWDVR